MQTFYVTRLALAVTFIGTSALSFNAAALPQAPIKNIASLKEACQQIALEDQLPESEIASFLLDCVNDQLTEMGYERVVSLD